MGKENDSKLQTANRWAFPAFPEEDPSSGHESGDYDPCTGTTSPLYAAFAARILADLQKGRAIFSF